MSNFTEKPLLLVTDKFELNQDGVNFIKSLSDKKIAIISVIGPKSSGKSFVSNQLIGRFTKGFGIGSIENRTECCTKGIWIWGNPIIHNDNYILILDAQGFQTENEEQIKFNQKLFILLNLISSTVIYNFKKDEESDDNANISEQILKKSYELFNNLLPFLDNVKLDKNNNKITKENIPNYYWLYRDYAISDFQKYIDMINNFNPTNEYYNSLFKNKIKYFSLPCPMEENEMLINLYLDEEDDGKGGPFDDEFKKKMDDFKKNIFGNIEPKNLSGNPLDCGLLETLLNDYTKCISLNETIFVNGPLDNLIKEKLEKIKNNIFETLKNGLNEKNKNINDLIIKIKNSYEVLSDKALNPYGESKIANNYLIENINNIIDLFGKEIVEKYLNNNISEYNDLIKNLISQKENCPSLLSNKINNKEDIKKYYNTFNDDIKKDLENNIFNSKNEFLTCFPLLKNYFEKCIINPINSYIDNIDNFVDITIKEQKASDELTKIVDEKNNEINNQKSQIEKMDLEIKELKNNLESKEKEYENNLNSKKEEYEKNLNLKKEEYDKLEQEKKNLIEEKDNLIKELQNKNSNLELEKKEISEKNENLQKNLDEMNNKNKELEQKVNEFIEKEKQKPKPQMVNVKEEDLPKLVELFKEIQSTTKEYNEEIKKYTKNKSKILYEKFIDEAKKTINDSCEGWVQELQKIAKEKAESKDDAINQEIAELKDKNQKLKEELDKVTNERDGAKNENKKLEEELKLSKDIKNDIDNYKKDNENIKKVLQNTNELYKSKIDDLTKKRDEMEFNLSTYKIESKIKEEEVYSTLNTFKSLIEKNKKNYELNFKKCPEEVKKEITSLNKKYKFIK